MRPELSLQSCRRGSSAPQARSSVDCSVTRSYPQVQQNPNPPPQSLGAARACCQAGRLAPPQTSNVCNPCNNVCTVRARLADKTEALSAALQSEGKRGAHCEKHFGGMSLNTDCSSYIARGSQSDTPSHSSTGAQGAGAAAQAAPCGACARPCAQQVRSSCAPAMPVSCLDRYATP